MKQWIDNERKKVAASSQALYTRNGDADAGASAKLTRLYKTDPESTVRACVEGIIDGVTGNVVRVCSEGRMERSWEGGEVCSSPFSRFSEQRQLILLYS